MLLNCTITKVTYPDCKVSFPKNLITSQVGLFSMNVVQKLIEGYNSMSSFPLYTHSFLTLHPENFVFSDCSLPVSLYCSMKNSGKKKKKESESIIAPTKWIYF